MKAEAEAGDECERGIKSLENLAEDNKEARKNELHSRNSSVLIANESLKIFREYCSFQISTSSFLRYIYIFVYSSNFPSSLPCPYW